MRTVIRRLNVLGACCPSFMTTPHGFRWLTSACDCSLGARRIGATRRRQAVAVLDGSMSCHKARRVVAGFDGGAPSFTACSS
jgi:hypothetical protein